MSDLKPNGTTFNIGGQEYGLLFSINVIDDIQDHFNVEIGKISDVLSDPKNQFKNLRWLITTLVNEWIDSQNEKSTEKINKLEERMVGRYITASNMNEIQLAFYQSFKQAAPEVDPN